MSLIPQINHRVKREDQRDLIEETVKFMCDHWLQTDKQNPKRKNYITGKEEPNYCEYFNVLPQVLDGMDL